MQQLNKFFIRVEKGSLVVLVLSMIALSLMQIVLRNFFDHGLLWAETLVRILVLWTALVGAALATTHTQHIAMQYFQTFLQGRKKIMLERVVQTITFVICCVALYHTTNFVYLEYIDGGVAFAQMPSWICESIIPIAFFLIAFHTLYGFLNTFKKDADS
jgi:TRAP-type C4-dicarboxylate transport system permease small subunit